MLRTLTTLGLTSLAFSLLVGVSTAQDGAVTRAADRAADRAGDRADRAAVRAEDRTDRAAGRAEDRSDRTLQRATDRDDRATARSSERAAMGVTFRNDLHDRAMVSRVVASGPADDAGIRRGDEVVAINGHDVKGFQDVI